MNDLKPKLKLSIITACFNSFDNLKSCLDSVSSQSYPLIEHIIVDGGSTDNTFELIKKYKNKNPNIIFISEPDEGIYDALNKGIKIASGDIIGFLHSDDFFSSINILDEISNKFIQYECDGVYGDLNYVYKKNIKKVIRKWKSSDFDFRLLRNGWMPPHPTLYLKKEVYLKHGLFDKKLSISADYDLILRVFSDRLLEFMYIPKVFVNMRIGGASNRNLENIFRKSRQDYIAVRKNNVGSFITVVKKNLSKLNQFF